MTSLRNLFAISALSLSLCASGALAQDHQNDRGYNHDDHSQDHQDNRGNNHDDHSQDHQSGYVRHDDWKRGHRLSSQDWGRAQRIDYRQYHLAAPRRGYEWREVDGNYVQAAIATGLISSIVIASSIR